MTGSSGNVGRWVGEELHAAGADVRCAVRPPSSGQLPEGTVGFDFTDERTWAAAFAGVRALFLVRPPAIGNVRRDLLPAVAAAREAGVEHVVFLSIQGADRLRVVPHATVERWLQGSGLGWTFVRPSFFTQNLSTTHAPDIRDRDEVVVPAGRGRTAFVDTRDVAAVAAAALLDPAAHRDQAWTPTGPEALTYTEVADVLTDVLGRPITYRDPGLPGWFRHARTVLGMPVGMAVVTAAIYTTARLGLAAGLTDHVEQVTGRPPASVRTTAVREQAAWRRTPENPRGGQS
ncbi:NmrA family NAD(P)-binding protein [Geodermatophilus sp. TF02-6]|uniref:NAD(P)H-binding protein n=1 Tax=Geodermatophilus sp. TF02-6 TaxID=2250575 RepID=UPI0013142930|nr:NmrA family NAD(P)-binding protein [Geodermatophilus sp. TF02-6]